MIPSRSSRVTVRISIGVSIRVVDLIWLCRVWSILNALDSTSPTEMPEYRLRGILALQEGMLVYANLPGCQPTEALSRDGTDRLRAKLRFLAQDV